MAVGQAGHIGFGFQNSYGNQGSASVFVPLVSEMKLCLQCGSIIKAGRQAGYRSVHAAYDLWRDPAVAREVKARHGELMERLGVSDAFAVDPNFLAGAS